MRVDAYLVSCCGKVVDSEDAVGLTSKTSLFEEKESYSVVTVKKSNIHFCMFCYRKYVLKPAQKQYPNRAKEEKDYQFLLSELDFKFKQRVYFSKIKK